MATQKRTDNKGRILKDGESQRKDGTYRFRYTDANGIRRDVYSQRLVPTDKLPPGCKDDLCLREKEKVIIRDVSDGVKSLADNKATLNDIFDLYMASKKELKRNTRTNYLYMYNKYVRDTLGTRKISTIKYSDIITLYNNLRYENGLKIGTVRGIHIILHPTFTLAVRDGYIRTNPSSGIFSDTSKKNRNCARKRHALTIDEQAAFIEYVKNHKIYKKYLTIFTVLLGTGCRVGEVIGLRWEDCNFDEGFISINHGVVHKKYEGEERMRYHIEIPKTDAGIRIIPMLSDVRKALQEERKRQEITGFNKSIVDGYSGFIFKNEKGNIVAPSNLNSAINRICKSYTKNENAKAIKEGRTPVQIRHFSTHNLRHTFCTRFCENENNIKVIQEIMGHSGIETTMNIYAEATNDKKKESFANLEGKIKIV